MSINSIFRTMSNAEKLSIGDIVKGVQTGSIPSYVGIPLIEKKTKEAQKLQMAQALMRQIQGGPPVTVTDQVMQAADQVTRPENPPAPTSLATGRQQPAPSMGIESAENNIPQEYAGGGIIAFAGEGPSLVEEAAGYTPKTMEELDALIRAQRASEASISGAGTRLTEGLSRAANPWSAGADEFGWGLGETIPKIAGKVSRGIRAISPYASLQDPRTGSGLYNPRKSMGEKTYEFMREWTKSPKERLQDVTPSSWWGPEVPGTTGPANVTPTDPDTAARILQGPDASAPTLQMPERPKIPMGIDSAPGATAATKEISPADWPITRTGDTTQATTPQAPATAQGSPWDDYMKSLRDERQELKDLILGQQKDRSAQEAENRNIALMKAGFGMMAGQSPFAGVNIGRGAMEGAEAYGKGLEQLRAGDRETIKQLVAMGFKGQELQNEAKRLGITEEYYRAHYPVLAAQARETEAKIPGLKATAGYTEAKTAAMPGEQALEERKVAADEYRALHPLRAAGAGAGKLGGIDPQAVKIQTEIRNSWIDQPLNPSNPFAKELQTRIAQDPRLAVALRGKPGDVLYDNAIARVVAPMAQKYADALQQGSMRQPVGYTDGSNEE